MIKKQEQEERKRKTEFALLPPFPFKGGILKRHLPKRTTTPSDKPRRAIPSRLQERRAC
jgi:hypothetical protein